MRASERLRGCGLMVLLSVSLGCAGETEAPGRSLVPLVDDDLDPVGVDDYTTRSTTDDPVSSTFAVELAAAKGARDGLPIAFWRVIGHTAGPGARIEALDAYGVAVRTVELTITDTAITASLDDVPVATLEDGAAFDALWMRAVADVESAVESSSFADCGSNCQTALKNLAHAIITNHLIVFTDVGRLAAGVVAYLCLDCFLNGSGCGVRPLGSSSGTCGDARHNLMTVPRIVNGIRDVRTYCACLVPGSTSAACAGDLGSSAAVSCTDAPCSEVCASGSGDIEVVRAGWSETCHCTGAPGPCDGNPDPCCGVVCELGQHCESGSCVPDAPDPCAGVSCPWGYACSPWTGLCEPTSGSVDCHAECAAASRCAGSISVWAPSGPVTCWCDASACSIFDVCDTWGYCSSGGSTCVLDGVCDWDEVCACDPACCGGGGGGGGGDTQLCSWCGGSSITSGQCLACGGTITAGGTLCDSPQPASFCVE